MQFDTKTVDRLTRQNWWWAGANQPVEIVVGDGWVVCLSTDGLECESISETRLHTPARLWLQVPRAVPAVLA